MTRLLFQTDEECLEAVKQNEWSIEYIKNPSLEVQLEAIREDEDIIQFIDNPSIEVLLELVTIENANRKC